MLPWDAVKHRLPEQTEAFWLAIRGNIEKFSETEFWDDVIQQDLKIEPAPEDVDFIAKARAALPPEPWDGTTWKTWTDALKASTDRKGKSLFMPLRMVLTGMEHGPELAALLPLIGRQRVLDRMGLV
jgi:glutamyl-tRNA synthetase